VSKSEQYKSREETRRAYSNHAVQHGRCTKDHCSNLTRKNKIPNMEAKEKKSVLCNNRVWKFFSLDLLLGFFKNSSKPESSLGGFVEPWNTGEKKNREARVIAWYLMKKLVQPVSFPFFSSSLKDWACLRDHFNNGIVSISGSPSWLSTEVLWRLGITWRALFLFFHQPTRIPASS